MAKRRSDSRLNSVLKERKIVSDKNYQQEDIGSPLARQKKIDARSYEERESSTPLRKRIVTTTEQIDDAVLEEEEVKQVEDAERREKQSNLRHRIFNILMVALSFYMVFLIYGVTTTQYSYNKQGKVTAEKMSVSDIKEKKEFEKILTQYRKARALYEKVLMFDKRLELDASQAVALATEYEGVSDDVEALYTKVKAVKVNKKYAQLQQLLLNWLKGNDATYDDAGNQLTPPTGLFMYVTYMSSAISKNDSAQADKAVQCRDNVYTEFSVISSDIITLGESLKGVDVGEDKKWSPETYVDEQVNGKKDKEN